MKRIALFLTCLFAVASLATAQTTKVTGTVVSAEDGEPIPGASVVIEGTKQGVVTDAEGKFTLTGIPAETKRLQISCAGMIPQMVKVKPYIAISLETDNKALDEVMVVAYGTATKAAFTGSATVVGADKIEALQSTNALDALTGHVAGVELYNPTGDPTNNNPTIRIRGIGSLNAGTSPLLVVDGTPYGGDMNTINTNDIESMTVLKDAAATSLYGARGANGVIAITTKKGKAGQGAKVTLDAKWGSNGRAQRDYVTVKNPGHYYETYYQSLRNYATNTLGYNAADANIFANQNLTAGNGYGLYMNIYDVPEGQYLIGSNGRLNPNARMGNIVTGESGQEYLLTADDWLKEAYNHGLRQEYNVSVSNATDKSNFYASFGYLNNDGITHNSSYESLTGRLKADLQAKPWLKVGGNMSYTHYNAEGMLEDGSSNSSANIFAIATHIAPIYPMYIRDGQGLIMTDSNGLPMYDWADKKAQKDYAEAAGVRPYLPGSNAVQQQMLDRNTWEGNAMNATGFLEIRFAKDFKFTSTNTMNLDESRSTSLTNPYYGNYASSNGIVGKGHARTWSYALQQLLTWGHQYGKHDVDAMLGHEWYRGRYYTLSASKSNMFDPTNYELAGAVTDGSNANSYTTDFNTEAYFARAQYNYAQKYFLSAQYRREASSRFSSEDGRWWGNFYSVGAAWDISQEKFMKDQKIVNFLKYKLSYGELGNDNIGSYLYTNRYSIGNSGGNAAATISSAKGNKDITWETTGEMNTGIEFGLWNNRLSGGIEYYWRKTRDMLYSFSLPVSYGFTGYYDNIGDMLNHGVEVELNADIFRTKNFTWNVGVNFSHFKNKITFMPDDKKTTTAYTLDGKEYHGYASGNMFIGEDLCRSTYYMAEYAGIYTQETAALTGETYDPSLAGSSMWWKDVYDAEGNRTGEKVTTTKYSDATKYLSGNIVPKLYGGFNTRFDVYGFDLTFDFAYQIGGKVYDNDYATFMGSPTSNGKGDNFHADLLNAWTPENTSTDIPRLQWGDEYSNGRSTRFLTKGSYLSLQNLSFGYTLPSDLVRKAKIDKVRVYLNASNVWLWSKRQGLDPRTAMTSLSYGQSVISYYSIVRTISAGVNVTF